MNLWILAGLFLAGLAWGTHFLNERIKMSTQSTIDAIVAQLRKAKDEIVTKLETATSGVQAQLVEAGVEDQVDLSALIAITQQLDDIVPDVEVEEAEEVVEVEVEEAEEAEEVDSVEEAEEVDSVEEAEEVEEAEKA